jgi:hypothetical protein
MKRTILRYFFQTFRVSVIVLSLAALVVSDASSATRLNLLEHKKAHPATAPSGESQILPAPPSADDAAHRMAPEGKPNTQPVALLAAPVLFQPDNDKRIDRVRATLEFWANRPDARTSIFASPICTVAMIAPQVGRQFTLVGAKPSGTS